MVKDDVPFVGVTVEDTEDRLRWEQMIHCGDLELKKKKKKKLNDHVCTDPFHLI